MPVATVSSDIAGYFLGNRFRRIDRIQGEAAAPGILLVALVLHDPRSVRVSTTAPSPAATARRRSRPAAPSGPASSPPGCRRVREYWYQRNPALAVGYDRDLSFFNSAIDSDLLAVRADQEQQVVFEDRQRAGAGRIRASVRNIARSASLRSNCDSAFALSPLGTILQPQPEELFFSTVASRAAKRRPSGPLPRRPRTPASRNCGPGPPTPHHARRSGSGSGWKTAGSGSGCS